MVYVRGLVMKVHKVLGACPAFAETTIECDSNFMGEDIFQHHFSEDLGNKFLQKKDQSPQSRNH